MKFRGCYSKNSTEDILQSYGLMNSKNALEFENCKQRLVMLAKCLPTCIKPETIKHTVRYASGRREERKLLLCT